MNQNAPLSPLPFHRLADERHKVVSGSLLRTRGLTPARVAEQCRPGGAWQLLLPGVYLLHPGTPTAQERLHAALVYAGRPVLPEQRQDSAPYGEAVVTGFAALALLGFSAAAPLEELDLIDVLVPRTRRLRSTGWARLVRTHTMPRAQDVDGVPVAPAPRALADALAQLDDAALAGRLLTEAVRGGHCETGSLVRELNEARLLNRPYVVSAVDELLAEGRSLAEGRLYALVRQGGLPDPLWNVDLRLPGGPHLGEVDAYWPEHSVAVELDTLPRRSTRNSCGEDAEWVTCAAKRDHLERLGITVVHLTPRKLREAPEQQATVVRTALMAAADREPAAYVVVLPR